MSKPDLSHLPLKERMLLMRTANAIVKEAQAKGKPEFGAVTKEAMISIYAKDKNRLPSRDLNKPL